MLSGALENVLRRHVHGQTSVQTQPPFRISNCLTDLLDADSEMLHCSVRTELAVKLYEFVPNG